MVFVEARMPIINRDNQDVSFGTQHIVLSTADNRRVGIRLPHDGSKPGAYVEVNGHELLRALEAVGVR